MLNKNILDEIGTKINEVIAHGPAKDIEKNLRAILTSMLSKLDLVTREEFDVQQEVLKKTRTKLTELEAKVALLENQLKPSETGTAASDSNYDG
ncbi:MAG: accessory factor UbiK family protein [Nitrosomonas sp.]|jgi:BMFP domain-containing protein YqiC|nr:accessory factor UbiK family protein [Nitrosomonas sp.]MBK7365129.1 accessory factor UbiK family protein [Nitrosomonas sp.]